jgi:hypothetical protein
MFRFVRDLWETLCAVVSLMRRFFVKWFLPLHVDDEEDDDEPRTVNWFDSDDEEQDMKPVADTVPRQIESSPAFPPPLPESQAETGSETGDEAPDLGERNTEEEDTAESTGEPSDDADRD